MPEATNVELVRAALETWNRGDFEATLSFCDPEVEWRITAPLLDLPEISHGHDGVRDFWRLWTSSWGHIRAETEEFIVVGDDVVALMRWRASGRAGVDVDQRVAFVFTIRDGLLTQFVSYWNRADAFAALGLPARG